MLKIPDTHRLESSSRMKKNKLYFYELRVKFVGHERDR